MNRNQIVLTLLAVAGSTAAFAYDLGPGDKLELRVRNILTSPDTVVVDPDGGIPVPLIGSFKVVGSTSEAASRRLREAYVERGLLKDPDVTLSLVQARPVYVEGDVKQPGAYPYQAGMTAQIAIVLAGGYRSPQFPADPSVLVSDAVTDLRSAYMEMVTSELKLARLTAELDDKNHFDYKSPQPPSVPKPEVAALYEKELDALTTSLKKRQDETVQLEQSRTIADDEIRAIDARTAALEKVVELQDAEVTRLKDLTSRQLSPVINFRAVERSAAQSRAELLQQGMMLAQARERRSSVDLNLIQRKADRRNTLLSGIIAARTEAAKQRARWVSASAKIAYVGQLSADIANDLGDRRVLLTVKRLGSPVPHKEPVTEDTELQAGDVVIVTVPLPASFRSTPVAADASQQ